MMRYFYRDFDGLWGFHMIGEWIMGILFLIVLVALIIYVVNKLSHIYLQTKRKTLSKSEAEDEALRILNIKFANGEISEEEYERKKKLLLNHRVER